MEYNFEAKGVGCSDGYTLFFYKIPAGIRIGVRGPSGGEKATTISHDQAIELLQALTMALVAALAARGIRS